MTETNPHGTSKRAEIMKRFPGLAFEHSRLRAAGIEPTGVLLPARLHDGPSQIEDRCMGLPITWSPDDRWGLIVHLPEPRL